MMVGGNEKKNQSQTALPRLRRARPNIQCNNLTVGKIYDGYLQWITIKSAAPIFHDIE
jgi:hypothetical protein